MVSCDPPLVYFPAPYPPDPLPRWGRGSFFVYFAGGFAPGTPAAEPERRLLALPLWYPAGGVPPALPARRALAVPCGGLPSLLPAYPAFSLLSFPHPPSPLPLRGRGRLLLYFAGGFAPGTPALNRLRRLQPLPIRCQTGTCLFGRLSTLPLVCFLSPIPPTPFPAGRGRLLLYFAGGFAPGTPAAEPIGLRKPGKKRSLRVIPPPQGHLYGRGIQCRKRSNAGDARGEAPCIRKL